MQQGYGSPPQYPQQPPGYGYGPPRPPPRKGLGTGVILLIAGGAFLGCCGLCVAVAKKGGKSESPTAAAQASAWTASVRTE